MPPTLVWENTDNAEIRLRLRPIREQWEGRGPGMLGYIQRRYSWIAYPDRISVELLDPHQSEGAKILGPARIQFEAFLANPLVLLPEIVRLAWLCTVAAAREQIADQPETLGIAFIPMILEAAEYVELAHQGEPTVATALENWLPAPTDITPSDLLKRWQALESYELNNVIAIVK